MSVSVFSALLVGLEAKLVEIEIDYRKGMPSFNIIGLADKSIQESKERVIYAVKNSGYKFQGNKRTVVNLAPADIPKYGPMYDLPIAVSYLLATGQVKFDPKTSLFLGELSLNGDLKEVNGIIPIASELGRMGFKNIYLPRNNALSISFLENINVYAVSNLSELVNHLNGSKLLRRHPIVKNFSASSSVEVDASDISGQIHAKRAMLISAAGGHNLLMSGSPGTGKSMMAKTYSGIIPPLSVNESIEVAKIYSVSEKSDREVFNLDRPYRAPHHTSSDVSLVGGGAIPRPGEISLAHNGVLFLDELPEFGSKSLDSLRQPLEEAQVTISRATQSVTYPANFTLIAAMNPCKCGYSGDDSRECLCSIRDRERYISKISGPILDRFDLLTNLVRENVSVGKYSKNAITSEQLSQKVEMCLELQRDYFKSESSKINSKLSVKQINDSVEISNSSRKLVSDSVSKGFLSARGIYKTIRVSLTIAMLEGKTSIEDDHLAEALSFRTTSL